MHSANWIANTGTIVGRGSVNGVFHPFIALPRAVPSVGPNLAFNGAYLNVLGDIPRGGSGVVITPSGHVIPWPPPTPMSRLMSEINTALSSIQDPELRLQMEARILAAVELAIRKGRDQ